MTSTEETFPIGVDPSEVVRPQTTGHRPGAAKPQGGSTATGQYFKMEFSPLRNPQSLGVGNSMQLKRANGPRDAASEAQTNAAAAFGTATVHKLKTLEECLSTFPVDGGRRGAGGDKGVPSEDDDQGIFASTTKRQAGTRGTHQQPAQSTVNNNNLNSTLSSTKDANAARRQKIESWVSVAERGNNKLRQENEILERIALLAQENCLDNDAKYEEALEQLRAELEFAEAFRQDSSETLANINERVTCIRELISELVSTAERSSQQEHEAVRAAFAKQLEEQKGELERVRENGKNTTFEWKMKNTQLQKHLEEVMETTQATYAKLQKLQQESQRLRVEFSAQAGDSDILEAEYRRVYENHQRLKDRLQTLERQLGEQPAARIEGGSGIASYQPSPPRPESRSVASLEVDLRQATDAARRGLAASTDVEGKEHEYNMALKRAQILFETEAANLKLVREAHLQTLKQRTELEVFLRQAIVQYKAKLLQDQAILTPHDGSGTGRRGTAGNVKVSPSIQGALRAVHKEHASPASATADSRTIAVLDGPPVTLTAEDRKNIMDNVLCKDRVLQLLYNEDLTGDAKRPGTGSFLQTQSASNTSAPSSQAFLKKSQSFNTRLANPQGIADSVVSPEAEEERELNQLYRQWQEWTSRANKAMYGKGAE